MIIPNYLILRCCTLNCCGLQNCPKLSAQTKCTAPTSACQASSGWFWHALWSWFQRYFKQKYVFSFLRAVLFSGWKWSRWRLHCEHCMDRWSWFSYGRYGIPYSVQVYPPVVMFDQLQSFKLFHKEYWRSVLDLNLCQMYFNILQSFWTVHSVVFSCLD